MNRISWSLTWHVPTPKGNESKFIFPNTKRNADIFTNIKRMQWRGRKGGGHGALFEELALRAFELAELLPKLRRTRCHLKRRRREVGEKKGEERVKKQILIWRIKRGEEVTAESVMARN